MQNKEYIRWEDPSRGEAGGSRSLVVFVIIMADGEG